MKTRLLSAFKGSALAAVMFMLFFSTYVPLVPVAHAQEAPLFSITLLAPTTNPIRRQHAALLANALQSVGVSARVVYVTFSDLINRLFPEDPEKLGATFEKGGYDVGFLGWGYTAPVPDIRSNYDGKAEAFPPTGNNYALFNNSESNALLQAIYTELDSTKQLELFRQLSQVWFREKPYIPVFIPGSVHARKPEIKIHGEANAFSQMATPFNDLQYMSGVTTYTFASAGDWSSLAPWQNSDSNSFYALFVYGVIGGGLQLVDTRTQTFFKNEAESITATPDFRTWTVKFKPGILFHDGVEATADDYLFTEWAISTPEVASVGLADHVTRYGGLHSFTWLNGTTTFRDLSDGALTSPTTEWNALDRYTYQFKVNPPIEPYAFLNLTETTHAPLPKHFLEQIPVTQWNQHPYATGLGGEYTFTWDTSKYGGSGTYTAAGPFGTGAYVYKGFDPVRRLARLEKFDQYWNRQNLESQGLFTVNTFNAVTIVEKDSAIAAYRTLEVDALDINYQLAADVDILRDLGANVITTVDVGWQEFGFNFRHPIVGTGLDTPAGRADPSKAAEAARHVRQAFSYLMPRELIVKQLLAGAGEEGTTVLKAFGSGFQDASIKPDPFDPNLARAELAAAGYATGVSPITPTPLPPEVGQFLLLGQTVLVEGDYENPLTNEPYVNFIVRIQVSSDNQTWVETGVSPLTDANGHFRALITPEFSTTYVRAFFPGFTVSLEESAAWFPARPVGNFTAFYDELVDAGRAQLVLPPATGPVQKLTLRTMQEILTDVLRPYATADSVSSLAGKAATKDDVSAVSNKITELNNNIGSLTTTLYASLGVAILAVIVAVVALRKRRGA